MSELGLSKEPLYYRVKRSLTERIRSGEFRLGDMLPSEDSLAEQYGVSRITVKRAVLDLAREGVVYRKQGKGTFVATPKIEEDIGHAVALLKPVPMHGGKRTHRLLSAAIISPEPGIAECLNIHEDERVVEVIRVKYADEQPIQLEQSYVPESVCPGLVEKIKASPATLMYEMLKEEYGIALMRAKLFIEPTVLTTRQARLLHAKMGLPAMLWQRITYTTGERPVELYKALVRGDRFKYYLEYPGGSSSLNI